MLYTGVRCRLSGRLIDEKRTRSPDRMVFEMQGVKRKIVYVILFEAVAIAVTSLGLALSVQQKVGYVGIAAVGTSVIAVLWNLIYNTLFEAWESRQTRRGRSVMRRICHTIGFQIGMVSTLVPFFAWWLQISLWQAFVLELGMMVFFFGYSFAFNLAFDRIFGLPASAQPV